jgi:hypothetical protein
LRDGAPNERSLSLRTLNHYLRVIKSFARWLHRDKRTRDDALAILESFNAAIDPRHVRRELSTEELTWLIVTTEGLTRPEHNLPGPTERWPTGWRWGPVFELKNCDR